MKVSVTTGGFGDLLTPIVKYFNFNPFPEEFAPGKSLIPG